MEPGQREHLQRLLVRLAEGDRSAFHPAFGLLWPILRGFARRLLGGEADADDAAQQALMKIFARASVFDQDRDALAWCLAIVANECRTLRRRTARRREEGPAKLAALEAPGPSTEERIMRDELHAAAFDLLGGLSPRDLEAVLAALAGEPAARPRISPAAFRKRVERALARLRQAWRHRHGSP